ncbi:hypothetical protein N7452_001056 [Penicillium brevicompactum]|uniref:Protein kinase domain-containing protein n=1 Tax=Penicillium brevicompactum TaxID=5074 RepID=A0A9W9R1M4_PENBR|nr:hypothetical protein N7452_001056 [Penicillium brevicompactum]
MDSVSSSSQAGSFVAAGTVSIIRAVDENTVIKMRPKSGDYERQVYNIEIRCYKKLGSHERIASCKVTEEGLLLERGTCLRAITRSASEHAIPLAMRIQWALEAAEGLAYIHSKEIIHADVGCHNMIVSKASQVKFIDFAGSGIDGEDAQVCYEWCSYRPGNGIGICSDIFAYGSMIFEIETGRVPYSELQESVELGRLMRVAEDLFSEYKFPPVDTLALGPVISDCWNGKYKSMEEVRRDVARCLEDLSEEEMEKAALDAE